MKRVVLHIGWPKTGTTSLQLFCRSHRSLLAEHGVSFPDLDASGRGEAGHEALLAAVLTRPPPYLASIAARSDAILRTAFADFEASPAHTLLLSHETLSQAQGVDHAKLRVLIGDRPVTVLAAIRTLDEWIESLYAQAIIAGHAGFKPIAKSRLGRIHAVRALPRLRAWRDAWPDADLRAVSFERVRGAGLVPGLLAAANLTGFDGAGGAARENTSPGALAALFVAYATLGTSDFTLARPLLAAWRAAGEPVLDGRFGVIPPALKSRARDAYRADLPALRRRFGLVAADVEPCSPRELDYRHTLSAVDYHHLLDRIEPHLTGPVQPLRDAYEHAAPRGAAAEPRVAPIVARS